MEERGKRSPIIIAVLFLIVVAGLLAYMTSRGQTVTPVPEEGLRVIFVSPQPTETPSPTEAPSPSPKPTVTPRPKVTTVPKPTTDGSITPTTKPTSGAPSATPKPTATVTPKP